MHFGSDPQVRDVMNGILKRTIEAHTCELNIAEYYYKACEKFGKETADTFSNSIREIPIKIHSPNQSLTLEAGSLKCRYRGKISLADAYILAIARSEHCVLFTTDSCLKEIDIVPTIVLKVP